MLTGRRILITGGAGFIGSAIAGRLLAADNELVLFDNLSRNALAHRPWRDDPRITLIVGDVLDDHAVWQATQGIDIIIHAAAIAGIDTVLARPLLTLQVNLLGTANVLEAASRLVGCQRVVIFSTSEVFGRHAFNARESEPTSTGPVGEARWSYAVSKLAGEHFAHAYFVEHGLPTVSLRPFNVYGPGQVGDGALHTFIEQALAGEPLVVRGGQQIRAWCYIDDAVNGVLAALESPAAIGQSFNIGNSDSILTIGALAKTVVRVLDSDSPVVIVQAIDQDVELRWPAVGKATEALGFTAHVDLEDGIRRTAEYYRSLESCRSIA